MAGNSHITAELEAGYFERLFEGAGLAIFACDNQGRVLRCSGVGEAMLRSIGVALESAAIGAVIPAADIEKWDDARQAVLRSGSPTEFRTRLRDLEHRETEYAVWVTRTPSASGKAEGLAVWFHDITDRLNVRRSTRKGERLAQLGSLSGAVAHHYNNALCCIATSLEYALNMNTMPAMRRALQRTTGVVTRAASLTRQLLAFAQADYGFRDMADLTETVIYYFDENEARLDSHQIKLDFDWEPAAITAFPRDQIMIVVDNIVTNAIEAMPSGGSLRVWFRQEDDVARLTITDSGPGMPPGEMDHLFEPFFTTKGDANDGDTRHTGMGLAVAHGLVHEMHGSISAMNAPGGGLRVEIIWPVGARSRSD